MKNYFQFYNDGKCLAVHLVDQPSFHNTALHEDFGAPFNSIETGERFANEQCLAQLWQFPGATAEQIERVKILLGKKYHFEEKPLPPDLWHKLNRTINPQNISSSIKEPAWDKLSRDLAADPNLSDVEFRTLTLIMARAKQKGYAYEAQTKSGNVRNRSRCTMWRHLNSLAQKGYILMRPVYAEQTGDRKPNHIYPLVYPFYHPLTGEICPSVPSNHQSDKKATVILKGQTIGKAKSITKTQDNQEESLGLINKSKLNGALSSNSSYQGSKTHHDAILHQGTSSN